MSSDRLFLEDACPTLYQRLLLKLADDPSARIEEHDFQDFEVWYALCAREDVVQLKVHYPYLRSVLSNGSQELLDRVWDGLPLRQQANADAGELTVELEASKLGDEAQRRRCAYLLAMSRTWLLIGPLVSRLRWLRQAVADADAAAKAAKPGGAVEAAAKAVGTPPGPLMLQVRRSEMCWIIAKPDRVLVIMSVHLEDEVDTALARAFCQEFAETNRKPSDFSLPCTFSEAKDPPSDLRGSGDLPKAPNVGYLTLTLSDQCVRLASEDRLHNLARPVMTFRNFFQFHLKHAKSFLHSRLRKRLDGWQQSLNRAKRAPRPGQEKRRLVSGKEFVPRPGGTAAAASAGNARS